MWNLLSHAFLETNVVVVSETISLFALNLEQRSVLQICCLLPVVLYLAALAEASIKHPLRFIVAVAVPLLVSSIIVWLGAVLVYVKSFETDHL